MAKGGLETVQPRTCPEGWKGAEMSEKLRWTHLVVTPDDEVAHWRRPAFSFRTGEGFDSLHARRKAGTTMAEVWRSESDGPRRSSWAEWVDSPDVRENGATEWYACQMSGWHSVFECINVE